MNIKSKSLELIADILRAFGLDEYGNKTRRLKNTKGDVDKNDIIFGYLDAVDKGFAVQSESKKQQALVYISIPQHYIQNEDLDNILESVSTFMSVCGFEYQSEEEPILGSFIQSLIFWTKKPKTQQQVHEIYDKGKAALEANYLGKPVAESTAQLSSAAAQLIAACQNVDEIVLRTGALIIVKAIIDGRTIMSVETISPQLMNHLDQNPGLLRDPRLVYHFLDNLPAALKSSSSQSLTFGG
ncbi:hypothetical protein ACFPAF_11605 [Hymenobacter endophyticus]|uniref:Uncharacterized protein n=1 Tax=Hymenobacter endophyticus TaxID=3076335 RepID=A0ABU3TI44_9BACT|nr:hypothetical protein [Hymenobacter endophyticus]MDU0371043.1 hypothetical protein [Hymenobacter endophyticus]